MNKQDAKQHIQKLVEKYQRVLQDGKIKSYNEAQAIIELGICKDFLIH